MKMVRKQVYITQEQDELLKRLAEERGRTEAEVIRSALDSLTFASYERVAATTAGRLREVAVMEYGVEDQTTTAREHGRAHRGSLAEKAWQEELAFMRSLAAARREGGTIERFNRDEVYEERLSKLLH